MPDTDTLVTMYNTFAGLAYRVVGLAVGALALNEALSRPKAVLAEINPARVTLATGVVITQLVVSLAALASELPAQLKHVFLLNWLMVLLAALVYFPAHHWCCATEAKTKESSRPHRVAGGALAAAVVIAFSTTFFLVAPHLVDIKVTHTLFEIDGIGMHFWMLAGLAIVAAPVEEILFRLGLQGALEKSAERTGCERVFLPIIISSSIWALGHAGMVSPPGVKEFQILVIGLVLGWTRVRVGFSACVVAHLALNLFSLTWEFYNQTAAG